MTKRGLEAYLATVKGINGSDELAIAVNEVGKLVEKSAAVYGSEL